MPCRQREGRGGWVLKLTTANSYSGRPRKTTYACRLPAEKKRFLSTYGQQCAESSLLVDEMVCSRVWYCKKKICGKLRNSLTMSMTSGGRLSDLTSLTIIAGIYTHNIIFSNYCDFTPLSSFLTVLFTFYTITSYCALFHLAQMMKHSLFSVHLGSNHPQYEQYKVLKTHNQGYQDGGSWQRAF